MDKPTRTKKYPGKKAVNLYLSPPAIAWLKKLIDKHQAKSLSDALEKVARS